jgi:hypothetical protein
MNTDGKWTTDFDHKATCKQDKVEILEYCKKVINKLSLFHTDLILFSHNYNLPWRGGVV